MLLSGCGEVPVLSNAGAALRLVAMGRPDTTIPRATISKLPYATMAAKVGRGPRAMLVLGRYEGRDLHWFAGHSTVIVTRGGRIVKTAGFPENLKDTRAFTADPVDKRLHRLGEPLSYIRYVDLDSSRRYGLPIHSRFETLREERITIAEIEFDTVLVRETNQAKTFDWNFVNLYWVDAIDGFVWKSRQHIARTVPGIDIEVLKPAA